MTRDKMSYKRRYKLEVKKRLSQDVSGVSLLTEKDIGHLPAPVQNYLRFTGAVGTPRVVNFRAAFRGEMKTSLTGNWRKISAEQYNFFDDPARLFYIRSSILGVPFEGLHLYIGGNATMEIALASLVRVVNARGARMTRGETVTLFNDMCILAPSTLIDTNIRWDTVDDFHVIARFSNKGNEITAQLTFDREGRLTDFLSPDRFLSEDGKTYVSYPWSTRMKEYITMNGSHVPGHVDAVWHMPGKDFVYAKYDLADIEYNCSAFHYAR